MELADSMEQPIIQAAGERAAMTPQDRIKENAELVTALAPEIKREHLANIQGKEFMCVGGGIAIANAMGYAVSVGETTFNKETGCYQATASMTNGLTHEVVASAVGYVGDDESRWVNGPKFALMSMTQTRAEAKLCRINFGHLYTLLGASSATPAEEMSAIEQQSTPAPTPAPAPAAATPKPQAAKAATPGTKCEVFNVSAVDELKRGNNAKGEWILTKVTTTSGKEFKTFSATEAQAATTALNSGQKIAIEWKEVQRGDFLNLDIQSVELVKDVTAADVIEDEDLPF